MSHLLTIIFNIDAPLSIAPEVIAVLFPVSHLYCDNYSSLQLVDWTGLDWTDLQL